MGQEAHADKLSRTPDESSGKAEIITGWRFSRCENPARKAGGTKVMQPAAGAFVAIAEALRSATEFSQRENCHHGWDQFVNGMIPKLISASPDRADKI
jgi:hypothetical protein